jgi:hypothetical protein
MLCTYCPRAGAETHDQAFKGQTRYAARKRYCRCVVRRENDAVNTTPSYVEGYYPLEVSIVPVHVCLHQH